MVKLRKIRKENTSIYEANFRYGHEKNGVILFTNRIIFYEKTLKKIIKEKRQKKALSMALLALNFMTEELKQKFKKEIFKS